MKLIQHNFYKDYFFNNNMKIKIILIIILISLVLVGCQVDVNKGVPDNLPQTDWMDIELKDIRTQKTFQVSDFKGQKILVESFAVWCPLCTLQQEEIRKLHQELGDSFVSISLDTDPNEDEARVIEHLDRNGFDWLYAIAPKELTQQLIDQFGVGIINAPAAPVLLVCEDQSTRLLKRGVKRVDTLKEELARGC